MGQGHWDDSGAFAFRCERANLFAQLITSKDELTGSEALLPGGTSLYF